MFPGWVYVCRVCFAVIDITNKGLTKRLLMLTDQKYNDVWAAAVPVDF